MLTEPNVCVIEVGDLVDKARVLVLQDGLLYAGYVVPMTPPDVYGVVIDGERGSRPHIYCREELLEQSVSIYGYGYGVLIPNVSIVSMNFLSDFSSLFTVHIYYCFEVNKCEGTRVNEDIQMFSLIF